MLTPEQMEEAVEAMVRASYDELSTDPLQWAGWEDDGRIVGLDGVFDLRAAVRAALTVALPVIERAVLNHVADWIKTQRNIVPANGWEFEEPIRAR